MLELTMRLVASLAVVVGLLLLLARVAGRRFAGREGAGVRVLHRQPLSRTASVAVLVIGSRVLVVGTTDHQVQLLAELDPDELDEEPIAVGLDDLDVVTAFPRGAAGVVTEGLAGPDAARRAGAHRAVATRRPAGQGGLAGSVLSPGTWRQAIAAATGHAS